MCLKFSQHIAMSCTKVFLARVGILFTKWVDFSTERLTTNLREILTTKFLRGSNRASSFSLFRMLYSQLIRTILSHLFLRFTDTKNLENSAPHTHGAIDTLSQYLIKQS